MKNLVITFAIIFFAAANAQANAPKPMTFDFTGYTVVIASSDVELADDDAIFQSFGEVIVTEVNGTFFYQVGQFKTEQSANDYMTKVISSRFPAAEVVNYENGARK